MKKKFFTFYLAIFYGLQVAKAQFLNLGSAEIVILVMVGFLVSLFLVAIILLCLYLVKRTKSSKHE